MQNEVIVSAKGLDWIVCSDGTIKTPAHTHSYMRSRNGKTKEISASFSETELSPYVTKSGYLEVAARKNGRRVKATVHRLVGMAFVPGFEPGLSINHINGVKTDNRPENLEWVSLAENTRHQWDIGLVDLSGEKHPSHKLTTKQVVYIRRLLQKGISAHALAIIAGVSHSLIDGIRDGRKRKGG